MALHEWTKVLFLFFSPFFPLFLLSVDTAQPCALHLSHHVHKLNAQQQATGCRRLTMAHGLA